jgi:hypothetical protein
MAIGKSFDEFRAKHDPAYIIQTPQTVLRRDLPPKCRRFIITAAQNGTPVHEDFWACLLTMARTLKAEILVIPVRYKNPTSTFAGSQQNAEWWAPAVTPYLWNQRHALNENLTLLADIKTQPTAAEPLSNFDAVSLASSGIVGHTKLQMRVIPTPGALLPKMLTTTGACTVPNYTDTKAGKVGEFHHSLSAVLVEVDGKRFHLRHVHFSAKGGPHVYDLDQAYAPTGNVDPPEPEALVMGDTHVDAIDPHVLKATRQMLATLGPKRIVHHDLLDAYSCNPHHAGNPFIAAAKRLSGRDDVRAEVQRALSFVRSLAPEGVESIVVSSNHDDMLSRWILSSDWKSQASGEFYLETALAMLRGTTMGPGGTEYPAAFAYWFREAKMPNARILGRGESLTLAGVELSMHGDAGPNGSRGSIRNLRRIGVKSIIGHSHTPGINEGCYQVGTSSRLQLEYNGAGPSSWHNAHCQLHADGKRQIIVIHTGGKWRL